MRGRATFLLRFAVLALAGALVAAAVAGAARTKISVGQYESAPVLAAGGDYTIGAFAVAKSGGKRAIVPGDGYAGIFYPDANECDDYDLPLVAQSIPISARGKFEIREKTPVNGSYVKVAWKGRWKEPGVVAGTIAIAYGDCTSRHRWSGGKVG
jgi:hypothetical protein